MHSQGRNKKRPATAKLSMFDTSFRSFVIPVCKKKQNVLIHHFRASGNQRISVEMEMLTNSMQTTLTSISSSFFNFLACQTMRLYINQIASIMKPRYQHMPTFEAFKWERRLRGGDDDAYNNIFWFSRHFYFAVNVMKAKQQNVMKAKPLNFARRSPTPHESHPLRLVAWHISLYTFATSCTYFW